jgi:alpha-glucosidase
VSAQCTPWWQTAVIYEVYPRSFADSDGDGVGDLRGLHERLPYLASLGVQGIWLTPFQQSPQVDQGYDISDYCAVDPIFGTLADFDALIAEAHRLGIRLLVDIVPNHTSTENELFRQAVAAGPGSPERELFHFVESPDATGETPPNNWISVFGGMSWSRADPHSTVDTQWYLHLFSPGQPDWNWENPKVWDYFDGVLRFWFDRGADGIRIDVAHGLFKAEGLPDSPSVPEVIDGLRSNPLAMDQDAVHDVYRHWRRIADEYDPPRLLVGEVNLEPARAARYTRPDELHQTFAFAFARLGWSAEEWVSVGVEIETIRRQLGADPSWALENHDLVRTPSRFGGGARGTARARAAVLALLGLPGSVYIYQGQELGLPEVEIPEDLRVDPMWARGGVSRDGARVPMPWTAQATGSHGFSPASGSPAWLPQPDGWGDMSVDVQTRDGASALTGFRAATALRRQLTDEGALQAGESASWSLEPGGLVLCARSGGITVAITMGDEPAVLPDGEVLITSVPLDEDGRLPADASAWIRRR